MQQLQGIAKVLAPMQGLSGLHTLRLAPAPAGHHFLMMPLLTAEHVDAAAAEGFEAVSQLTRLRELSMNVPYIETTRERLLRPLTQLQQLTRLAFVGPRRYILEKRFTLVSKASPTLLLRFLSV
jgi:hypothetical protein